MRIAHLPASFLPVIGGAEISTHNIALRQHRMGHEVYVLVHPSIWKRLAPEVPYRLLPYLPGLIWLIRLLERWRIPARWLWEKQIAWFQRRYRFDVWHFNLVSFQAIFALPALNRLQVPTVGTCRGSDIQKMPEVGYGVRLDPELDLLTRKAVLGFDMVTAISNSVREEYLKIGVPPERIRNIPNGVDLQRIKGQTVDPHRFRARMQWPEGRCVLLTVGRNHPKKGYTYIPEILKLVIEERRDVLWVIVGRGCEPILEKAQSLGVEKYIRLVPELGMGRKQGKPLVPHALPTSELIELYKSSDLLVFPTLLETFGNIQTEAMAAGLPIVTTDAPGCRDLVRDGDNGLISPVHDVGTMAKNIILVLQDHELRERLVRNGSAAIQEFEWDDVAARYCAVYDEAVRHRGR